MAAIAAYNEAYLFKFPSFPGISLEERRQLTRTTMLTFAYTESGKSDFDNLYSYICRNMPIDSETNNAYQSPYFGPYDTTVEEFLKLPEIACVVYPILMTDTETEIQTDFFQSFMKLFNEDITKYHNFRSLIVKSMKTAAKCCFTDEFGYVTLNNLCKVFRSLQPIYRNSEWEIDIDKPVAFLDDKLLLYVLCVFCSRDLVIRISGTEEGSVTKIRLRNDPKYLLEHQIKNEQILAEKAVTFYFKYRKENPENIDWKRGPLDISFEYLNSNDTVYSSNQDYGLDNIYAALHFSSNIRNHQSLCETILRYACVEPGHRTYNCLTPNTELNLLLDMISSKGLAPLEYWEADKIKIYMKIVHEITANLSETDRIFVFNFIELSFNKSHFIKRYSLWCFLKISTHILFVTRDYGFISADKIEELICEWYKYNVKGWLKVFGLSSIEDLFNKYECKCLLNAICIKTKNGRKLYQNMESIIGDETLHLFPFTAKERFLNCLHKAKLINVGQNGFINEAKLAHLYDLLFDIPLDSKEKLKLFGDNCSTVWEFFKEFECKGISVLNRQDGEVMYGFSGDFESCYAKILEEKKQCREALKLWNKIHEKYAEKKRATPYSSFTLWKNGRLNYTIPKSSKRRNYL